MQIQTRCESLHNPAERIIVLETPSRVALQHKFMSWITRMSQRTDVAHKPRVKAVRSKVSSIYLHPSENYGLNARIITSCVYWCLNRVVDLRIRGQGSLCVCVCVCVCVCADRGFDCPALPLQTHSSRTR
jgi:hypothetical protein